MENEHQSTGERVEGVDFAFRTDRWGYVHREAIQRADDVRACATREAWDWMADAGEMDLQLVCRAVE